MKFDKPICKNCFYCKCSGRTDGKYSLNGESRKMYFCTNPVALNMTDSRGFQIYTFVGFGDISYESPLNLKTCKRWCPIKAEQNMLCFLNKHYKSGDLIYPLVIAKSIKTNIDNIHEILEKFLIQDIVKKYFDIYCPHCCKFTGERYTDFVSIPDTIFCSHCDCEITNCSNQLSIIYKML